MNPEGCPGPLPREAAHTLHAAEQHVHAVLVVVEGLLVVLADVPLQRQAQLPRRLHQVIPAPAALGPRRAAPAPQLPQVDAGLRQRPGAGLGLRPAHGPAGTPGAGLRGQPGPLRLPARSPGAAPGSAAASIPRTALGRAAASIPRTAGPSGRGAAGRALLIGRG